MKKYQVLLAFLCGLGVANGQSPAEVGRIALSVIMPEQVDPVDASQLSKVESKITTMVTESGLAASGYNNNFVIYPKFAIYETQTVEAGMENILVVTCELSLFIQQVDNNLMFSSYSKTLKGSGKTQVLAVTNAISTLTATDPKFKAFIVSGKEKIIQYYESNCDMILAKARSLVNQQDYQAAIGFLMTVPEEVSCYSKVQSESIITYKAYQDQKCNQEMQLARAELAANRYGSALGILGRMDPSAFCYAEAQRLGKEAALKVDAEERKQWDLRMKMYNNAIDLEMLRINAAKEVAAAYYHSKPTTVTYTYLVR